MRHRILSTFLLPLIAALATLGVAPASAQDYTVRIPVDALTHTPTTTVVDFGNVVINTPATRTLVFTNRGSAVTTITAVSKSGSPVSLTDNSCVIGKTLAANESCQLNATLTPLTTTRWDAVVSVAHSAATGPDAFALKALGVDPSQSVVFDRSFVDFGGQSVQTTSEPQTLVLRNNSAVPVGVTAVKLSGSTLHFQMDAGACETTLSPGDSCEVTATFSPKYLGTTNTRVMVELDDGTLLYGATLAGTGVQGVPTFDVSTLNFRNAPVGIASLRYVTLTNTGGGAFGITNLAVSGDSAFTLAASTCGTSLAAGAHCSIAVSVTPVSMDARTGVVTLESTGTSTRVNRLQLFLQPTVAAPGLAFAPATLDFAPSPVGQPFTMRTYIQSTGNAPAAVSGYTLTGPHAADFQLVNASSCVGSLDPGMQCALDVQVKAGAAGSRVATLEAQTDSVGTPPVAALSASGLVGHLTVTPASVVFDSTQVGQSSQKSIVLTNDGKASLQIQGVRFSGVPLNTFTSAGCVGALAVGQSCTMTLSFAPKAAGLISGSLDVTESSDPAAHVIGLSASSSPAPTAGAGTTLEPDCSTPVQYGRRATCTVTVQSSGTADLVITGYALARTQGDWAGTLSTTSVNAAAFANLKNGASYDASTGRLRLPPGASAQFSTTLNPQSSAAGTATQPSLAAYTSEKTATHINTLTLSVLSGTPLTTQMPFTVELPNITATMAPSSLTVQAPGTGTTEVTLTNAGRAAVRFATALTGTPAAVAGYAQTAGPTGWMKSVNGTCTPTTVLQPGQSCTTSMACAATTANQLVTGTLSFNTAVGFQRATDEVNYLYKKSLPLNCQSVPPNFAVVSAYPKLTGEVATGSLSGNWMKVVNNGQGPITFSGVTLGAGLLAVTDANDATNCVANKVLAPGQSCVFYEAVTATNLLTTPLTVSAPLNLVKTVQGNKSYASTYVVHAATVEPVALDSTPLIKGASRTVAVKVTNTTPSDLADITPVLPAQVVLANNGCSTLAPGASCQFSVTWTPPATWTNDTWPVTVQVSGRFSRLINGVKAPTAGLSTAGQWVYAVPVYTPKGAIVPTNHPAVTFNKVSTAVQTVRNTGKGPLTIGGVAVRALTGFAVSDNRCPEVLQAGAECTFLTSFSSGTFVNTTGTLEVQTNAGLLTASSKLTVIAPAQLSTVRYFGGAGGWNTYPSKAGGGMIALGYVSPNHWVEFSGNLAVGGGYYYGSPFYSQGLYFDDELLVWGTTSGTGTVLHGVHNPGAGRGNMNTLAGQAPAGVFVNQPVRIIARNPQTGEFYAIGTGGLHRFTVASDGHVGNVTFLGGISLASGTPAVTQWTYHQTWGGDGAMYLQSSGGVVRLDVNTRQASFIGLNGYKAGTGMGNDSYGNVYVAAAGGIVQLPWDGSSFGPAKMFFPANAPYRSSCISSPDQCDSDGNSATSSMWFQWMIGPSSRPNELYVYEQGTGGGASALRVLRFD